jgi:HprK-related kinase A
LLSDELGLVCPVSGTLVPMARPIILKNGAIEVIRNHASEALFGPVIELRAEGMRGCLARPPRESVEKSDQISYARFIVFPTYQPDAAARLSPVSKGEAFLRLAQNSFNLPQLGVSGFRAACRLIDECDCYEFTYSRLEEALQTFRELPIPALQPVQSPA